MEQLLSECVRHHYYDENPCSQPKCPIYVSQVRTPNLSNWQAREPPFSNTVLDLRFDVLVHAKEVLRVVLLLNGHEPLVVGTVGSFDRVFSLLT
jgi:hypothetical protein